MEKTRLTVMVRLVITGGPALLAILVGRRLPIGARGLRRVSRWRSLLLLLLGLLLVGALLLAVTCLLGLVSRLLLAICRWLGITVLVVTCWLAVSTVTGEKTNNNPKRSYVRLVSWSSI